MRSRRVDEPRVPRKLELRELRSAGAVFGLLDVDDEFFVIVGRRPSQAPGCSCRTPPRPWSTTSPRRCLNKLDADVDLDDLEDEDPFEEGDLGCCSAYGLSEGVFEHHPRRRRVRR